MRVALIAVVLAVTLTPSAAGRADELIAIRPGVGIGPLNLGMTGQDVRRVLGRPRAVVDRSVCEGSPTSSSNGTSATGTSVSWGDLATAES